MLKLMINGEVVEGISFAYDGCHKIYVCENVEQEQEMSDLGYGIYPIEYLPSAYENSCGLRFISSADLKHQYVKQFADNVRLGIIYENAN